MLAEEARNCIAHRFKIQRLMQVPGAVQIERRLRGTIEDVIFVHPAASIAPRVEGVRNNLDFLDGDIVGCERIDRRIRLQMRPVQAREML